MEIEVNPSGVKDEKTSNKEKKLWAKRSYQTADLLVTMGYYFGSIPVYWNRKEHKMELVTSVFGRRRWLLTIITVSIIQVAIMVTYSMRALASDDPLKYLTKNTIHASYAGLSGFTLMFHLHTVWKHKEFVSFINTGANFYESFQSML